LLSTQRYGIGPQGGTLTEDQVAARRGKTNAASREYKTIRQTKVARRVDLKDAVGFCRGGKNL